MTPTHLVFTPTPSPEPEYDEEDDPEYVEVKGLKYKLDRKNKTAAVIGPVDKDVRKVTIPATLKLEFCTYKVTSVAKKAFRGLENLESVTIGKNVETIGEKAFENCESLKRITLRGRKLVSVGSKAFKGIDPEPEVYTPGTQMEGYRKLLMDAGLPEAAVFKKLK